MKGDFSRDSFDASKRYTRVLLQQGRVALDADWNEQGAIFLAAMRRVTADVIGSHGGPASNNGFKISGFQDNDFNIGAGRYYVAGLPCECASDVSYREQAYYQTERPALHAGEKYLAYLEAWESEVTALDDPTLLEPALAGEDTALRSRVVWRVKAARLDSLAEALRAPLGKLLAGARDEGLNNQVDAAMQYLRRPTLPKLEIVGLRPEEDTLVRVEVHAPAQGAGPLTLKWARRNASFQRAVRVEGLANGLRLIVRGAPLASGSIEAGNYVELSTAAQSLEGAPGQLVPVNAVRHGVLIDDGTGQGSAHVDQIDVDAPTLLRLAGSELRMRRWDGMAYVNDGGAGATSVRLGALVDLQMLDVATARTGDVWMLPLRANGWPRVPVEGRSASGHEPIGPLRERAPLSIVTSNANVDLRRQFRGIAQPL